MLKSLLEQQAAREKELDLAQREQAALLKEGNAEQARAQAMLVASLDRECAKIATQIAEIRHESVDTKAQRIAERLMQLADQHPKVLEDLADELQLPINIRPHRLRYYTHKILCGVVLPHVNELGDALEELAV